MTEALGSVLEKPLWLEAMTNDNVLQLTHLMGNLVLSPKEEKFIGCMWVLSCKLNEVNEVIRHKACGVGFKNHQESMKHFYKMYTSVGRIETFKILLLMLVTYQWLVFQFDVEMAFLHGNG
jgi:hypothetical protein